MPKRQQILQHYDVKTIDTTARSPSPSLPSIEFLPVSAKRVEILHPEAQMGRIVENKILTKAGTPAKRHIGKSVSLRCRITLKILTEISLPDGLGYRAGDYLSMLVFSSFVVVCCFTHGIFAVCQLTRPKWLIEHCHALLFLMSKRCELFWTYEPKTH